jgi:hypothetical protein
VSWDRTSAMRPENLKLYYKYDLKASLPQEDRARHHPAAAARTSRPVQSLRPHDPQRVRRLQQPPDPMKPCEQQCGRPATVYAVDPYIAGGWGGYYCEPCVKALCFEIVDHLKPSEAAR